MCWYIQVTDITELVGKIQFSMHGCHYYVTVSLSSCEHQLPYIQTELYCMQWYNKLAIYATADKYEIHAWLLESYTCAVILYAGNI